MQRLQRRHRLLREQQEQSPDVRLPAELQDQDVRLPESKTPGFPIREFVLKSEVSTFDWAVQASIGRWPESSMIASNYRSKGKQ